MRSLEFDWADKIFTYLESEKACINNSTAPKIPPEDINLSRPFAI